jgi:hypothetical protein
MENAEEHKHYKIIVNGEEKTESKHVLTFKEVLDLAFPPPRTIPEKDYSITFKNAESKPHNGQLHVGGTVEVKNGTSFDVTPTSKS